MTMTMAAADTHYNEGQRQQDQQQQHDQLAILICSANIGNAEPTRESFDAWIPNDGECCVRSIGSDSGSGGGDDDDDDIGKMARGGNCCIVDDDVDDRDDDGDNTNKIAKKEAKQKQKFDIIVIGMQEAAFIKTSSSHSNNKLKATDDEDDNTKISKYDGVAVSTDDDDDENDNNDTKEDGNGNVGIVHDGNGDEDEGVRDCRSSGDDSGGSNGDGTTTTCGVLLDMVNDGITGVRKGSERSGRRMIQNIGRGNLFMRGLGISSPTRLPRTMLNKAPTVRDLQSPFLTRTRTTSDDATTIIAPGSTTATAASTWGVSYDTKKLLKLISDRLPSYEIITSNLRGQMRMYVLALKNVVNEIVDVRVAGENTGLGSVLANKGGTIVTLTIRGTRLSFMNAHLAAHEGSTNYANRNRSLQQILAGARTDSFYSMHDASIISHHMFISGDLNYRINFDISDNRTAFVYGEGESPSYGNTASNGQHFSKAKEFIDAEDWNSLVASDELAMALRRKECLFGFTTLPCNFPPTFKLERGEGYKYKQARTPSYTDRILWKSADGLADNVEPILYEPCPGFITSDHKPIRGGYLVKTISGNPVNQSPPVLTTNNTTAQRNHDRKVHLLISDIKCTGLPVMDSLSLGGLCDPYILFMSYPKSLLYTKKKSWPSTKVIKRTLNPVWEEVVHVSLDQGSCNNSNKIDNNLAGAMLYLTVMDDDYSIDNEVVGTVALNLKDLCSNLNTPGPFTVQRSVIKRPILRNGQEYGMLECTISSAYCSAKEDKAFVDSVKRVKFRSKMNPFQQAIRKVRSF